MFRVVVQKLGDVTVFRCVGRLVIGNENLILRNAVLADRGACTVILDLAQVDDIDAGGLGMLMNLRELSRPKGIEFQLMNVTNRVQQILELTNLDQILKTCTLDEMFHQPQLHRGKSLWRGRAA